MWEPSQATSDIDMYWVGPVCVWCGGKGTAPGCAQKREPNMQQPTEADTIGDGENKWIQVLAARAHPIQEVYQATSNWTMPELRAGETQLEQSDREIASWRLNHAGHWQEQTEPPLSVVYLKTKVGGKSADMKSVRLRLILVSAADVRGAENWLGPLKTCGFASVAWLGILPKVACHGEDGR